MHAKGKSQDTPKEASGRRAESPGVAESPQHLTHPAALAARAAAGALTPRDVLQLQSTLGNGAVSTLLAEGLGRGATRGEASAEGAGDGREDGTARPVGDGVLQLFTDPPDAPPAAGQRGGTLNGHGVPTESHVTTVDGAENGLVGTLPGVAIHGWNYIQNVGAAGPWVRFHLINRRIGGRGDQDNLVPTSHATNHTADWKNFESTCKEQQDEEKGMHVTVDVEYPAPAAHPVAGTLEANQHFYPDLISGRCYVWNRDEEEYELPDDNGDLYSVDVTPFPLQPPAAGAETDLTEQTHGWIRNTLMGGEISAAEAVSFWEALQGVAPRGTNIEDYRAGSWEPTDEMKLLDALDSFLAIELDLNVKVPDEAREQILNGAYHI